MTKTTKPSPTEAQISEYRAMSEKERKLVDEGYATVVVSLTDGSTICEYNMPPKGSIRITKQQAERLARGFIPAILKYYEDPKNREAFEQWKKERDEKAGKQGKGCH